MKKTLQDQYLLIKEGKGHKGVFLTEAKRQFPNIVRNAATFDEAVSSLKTKNIISENVISVMPAIMDRPKKEAYETAFEAFLAEARKKENEDEKVKAEEKKVSKPVEKDLKKNFDYSDEKNPDNMIFDQIMMGYYAEMKDPKNADKTMQELKDIVFKNLSKDPIHYTKDGQFGVKDLGYVTEAPGLGTPKEPKGKYKSSGYGDLNESKINEISEKDINMMDELDLKSKLTSMGVTPIVIDSILSTSGIEGLRDRLRDKLKDRAIGFKESKEIEDFKAHVKKAFSEKPGKKFTPEEIEAKLNQLYPRRAERKKDTPEESKLREVIREMIAGELKEVLSTNEPSVSENVVSDLRESVEKDLADINKEAEHEVLQSKLDKIDALIDHRRSKLSKLDEDEDMKALTDKKKVKEIEKDIKKLEVARNKVEKMMAKFKGKKSASKKVIDEMEDEPSSEYMEYKEDAERRYDEGQDIDSIIDTYTNISLDMKNQLRDDLEGKMNGMDY